MEKAGVLIYRRLLVASIIAILVFPMLGVKMPDWMVRERTQPLPRPAQLWGGIVKREWQQFLEQSFLSRMGSSRSFLILSYNEARHRLFPTRPNDNYLWTPEFGYYPVDTIRRLNGDVLRHDAIKQHYQAAARRLHILQEILGHHGVALLVVVAPAKARLYPEYVARYLIASPDTIMSRAVSYGQVLEENGINVLNTERFFAERKAHALPFFTTTSFHWSVWAGCTVADEIMHRSQTLTGRSGLTIDCSDVRYEKSQWTDTDIALGLNIFSTNSVIGEAPFPKISPQKTVTGEVPKMLIIGDSFSDQLVYALTGTLPDTSWSPQWLTRYDNFRLRQTAEMGGNLSPRTPLPPEAALPEILTKDLLIIEVSDSAIYRDAGRLDIMEYGATQTLLDGLLPKADADTIDPANSLTSGWRRQAGELWQTVGPSASFAIGAATNGNPISLALDVEDLRPSGNQPRAVTVLLDGEAIGQATLPAGRGTLALTVPATNEWRDSLAGEISLRDASSQPLDLVLHGMRIGSGGADRKKGDISAVPPQPPTQTPNQSSLRTINLFSAEVPNDVVVEGLSGLESNGKQSWRWALGPATRIKFYVDPAWPESTRRILLKFAFTNGAPIPDQTLIIRLNGEEIRRFSWEEIGVQKQVNADMALNAKAGLNVLEFTYGDWNHGKKDYGPTDPRQLAVAVTRLSLQPAKSE
jgi:hypothetical protein